MKDRLYIYMIGCLLAILFFIPSCEKEVNSSSDDTGYILLGVEKNEVLYTKAGEPITDEILGVYFINTATTDTIKQFENYKEEVEGQRILLPAATYDIVITSSSPDEPAWDTPVYYADTTLTVKSGEIASAALECKIANTKVTVDFTSNVATYFSYYEAIVTGKSGELTFAMDETRAGFYFTDKLTVTLNLINKNNGLAFQFIKVFPDIQPRYHYKLKFDTTEGGDNAAGGNIEVSINVDLEEIEYTIKLPEYTQLMDMPKAPTTQIETQLTGKEETSDTHIAFKKIEGETIADKHQLIITTQAGLKNLYIMLSQTFRENDNFPEIFDWLNDENEEIRNKLNISGSYDTDQLIYTLDMKGMLNNYLTPYEKSNKVYTLQIAALDVYQQEIITTFSYTVSPDLDLLTDTPDIIWATFAVLKGSIDPVGGSDAKFIYGKSSDEESSWKEISINNNEYATDGTIQQLITGLEPNTAYSYKLVGYLNNEYSEGDVIQFQTEATPTIPNLNFDDWYTGSPNSSWFPGTDADNLYWDSGNKGANTVSAVNPTSKETGNIVLKEGNQAAAKLTSSNVNAIIMTIFAADNIYTGAFVSSEISISNPGAQLDFGIAYEGRPTKMSGYYMYQPVTINTSSSAYSYMEGQQDTCSIYIALFDENWNGPFRVNTQTGTFVDFSVESCIGYGELSIEEASKNNMSEYSKFEIDINYRNYIRKPKYVLIVASASKYGDYFTGGVGSTLYIDEFELSFDYNAASFAGTNSILENN
ncbi:MAG: PCMD domain-containing protein [Tannerellaceae bacterium]|nr:PCMD domain-containing protein [Tannerellaceae bacterium]